MDLNFDRRYFDLIVRWLWLIALASAVAAGVSYYFSSQETLKYVAKARLIVGPGVDSSKPNINDLRTSGALMQTYAELALTRPLLERVAVGLGGDVDASKLSKRVEVKANTETLILTIQASDNDPESAVAIANAMAQAVVDLPQTSMEEIIEGVRQQVAEIESEIQRTSTTIDRLEAERQASTDLAQQKLLQDQIKDERSHLTDSHKTLASLYESLQQTVTNQVKLVEPAVEAVQEESTVRLNVMVAALAGLVLSLIVALVVEFLDTRVKTTDQLAALSAAPLMLAVKRHALLGGTGVDRLVVKARPDAKAAEGYRMLAARLLFARDGQAPRTMMCCGPAAAGVDDSAEAAANLAVILAESGYRVVLVDANLAQPSLAEMLGIADRGGLAEALLAKDGRVSPTALPWAPGLRVLPAGGAAPEAMRRLASPRLAEVIGGLSADADIVIVVTAPVLASAESLAVAPHTDGVLFVARSGRVDRTVMAQATEQVHAVQATLFGVVLTQARRPGTASPRPAAGVPVPMPAADPTRLARGELMLPLASPRVASDPPAT